MAIAAGYGLCRVSEGTKSNQLAAVNALAFIVIVAIIEACCASDDANQCPGRYMQGIINGKRVPEKGGAPNRYLLLKSLILGRGMRGTRMCCVFPSNFVSEKFPGTSLFCHNHPRTSQYQVKSTMAATSLNEEILAPTLVGAGSGNAAKGMGMAGGKRNASLSPPKLRVSSNLDGCCSTLWPKSPSKSDIAAGDTRACSGSKKTWSAASEPAQSTKAPESLVSPAGRGAQDHKFGASSHGIAPNALGGVGRRIGGLKMGLQGSNAHQRPC